MGQFLMGATKEAFDALCGGQTKHRNPKTKNIAVVQGSKMQQKSQA